MKRILAVVLSIAMLINMQFTVYGGSSSSEEFVVYYFFNNTYDTLTTGEQPNDSRAEGGTLEIAEIPSATDKSAHFNGSDNISNTAFINGSVNSKQDMVISCDLRIEKLAGVMSSVDGKVSLEVYNNARTSFQLLNIDKKGRLHAKSESSSTFSNKSIATLTQAKFQTISVAIDADTGNANIYLDGALKYTDTAGSISYFTDIGEVRLNMAGYELYVDNFCAYAASEPIEVMKDNGKTVITEKNAIASDSEVTSYMGDSLVFYNGKNTYYNNGSFSSWGGGELFKVENGVGYVNSAFVTDVLGATASSDTFTEISALASAFGKQLTLDKNGMAVIAGKSDFFNMQDDISVYRALARELVFENVSGNGMISAFNANADSTDSNHHPRLFANKTEFASIKNSTDTNIIAARNAIITKADTLLNTTPRAFAENNDDSLYAARDLKEYSLALGFAYQMTDDTKYSDKLAACLTGACDYTSWYPRHFLSTGEFMFAVAVGYDWIYDELNNEQKTNIETALVEFGLLPALEDYTDVQGRDRSFKWVQEKTCSNWKMVCNTGVIAAASVLLDKTTAADEPTLLDYAMENIQESILGYAPDGGWFEGTTYWQYATMFFGYFINILDSVYGTDYGYMDSPGLSGTVDYILGMQGENGAFNFGDSNHVSNIVPEFLLFAQKLDKPAMQKYYMDNSSAYDTVFVFNYTAEYAGTTKMLDVPLDYYARDVETATFHSAYGDNSIFTALHAGDVSSSHGQYDAGQFVIDANGTDFITELGSASYSVTPQNYLYRRRAEGHNVPVLNPDYYPGQMQNAFTRIDKFASDDEKGFAVTDLSAAYSKDASSVKRGLMLNRAEEAIILQDEITMNSAGTIRWGFHSPCTITLSNNNKTATFTASNGKTMTANIVDGSTATFTAVGTATPSSTSPKISGDTDDSSTNKLFAELSGAESATLAIAFTFGSGVSSYALTPLDDWALEEITVVPETTDTLKTYPTNDTIIYDEDELALKALLPEGAGSNPTVSFAMDGTVLDTPTKDTDGYYKLNYDTSKLEWGMHTFDVTVSGDTAMSASSVFEFYGSEGVNVNLLTNNMETTSGGTDASDYSASHTANGYIAYNMNGYAKISKQTENSNTFMRMNWQTDWYPEFWIYTTNGTDHVAYAGSNGQISSGIITLGMKIRASNKLNLAIMGYGACPDTAWVGDAALFKDDGTIGSSNYKIGEWADLKIVMNLDTNHRQIFYDGQTVVDDVIPEDYSFGNMNWGYNGIRFQGKWGSADDYFDLDDIYIDYSSVDKATLFTSDFNTLTTSITEGDFNIGNYANESVYAPFLDRDGVTMGQGFGPDGSNALSVRTTANGNSPAVRISPSGTDKENKSTGTAIIDMNVKITDGAHLKFTEGVGLTDSYIIAFGNVGSKSLGTAWHNLKVALDYDDKKAYVYVDGEMQKTIAMNDNAAFCSQYWTAEHAGYMAIQFEKPEGKSAKWLIDDLNIYWYEQLPKFISASYNRVDGEFISNSEGIIAADADKIKLTFNKAFVSDNSYIINRSDMTSDGVAIIDRNALSVNNCNLSRNIRLVLNTRQVGFGDINAVNINGTINVSFDGFHDVADTSKTYTLYIAEYSGSAGTGELIKISGENIILEDIGNVAVYTASMQKQSDNSLVKVYLWENDLKPLRWKSVQ